MKKIIQLANVGDELAIAWSDGTENYIKHEKLRRSCPCASCQGEPDALGRVVRPKVSLNARSFELVSVEEIGGYALQIKWGDGHSTGIYSFDLLRQL